MTTDDLSKELIEELGEAAHYAQGFDDYGVASGSERSEAEEVARQFLQALIDSPRARQELGALFTKSTLDSLASAGAKELAEDQLLSSLRTELSLWVGFELDPAVTRSILAEDRDFIGYLAQLGAQSVSVREQGLELLSQGLIGEPWQSWSVGTDEEELDRSLEAMLKAHRKLKRELEAHE